MVNGISALAHTTTKEEKWPGIRSVLLDRGANCKWSGNQEERERAFVMHSAASSGCMKLSEKE